MPSTQLCEVLHLGFEHNGEQLAYMNTHNSGGRYTELDGDAASLPHFVSGSPIMCTLQVSLFPRDLYISTCLSFPESKPAKQRTVSDKRNLGFQSQNRET